VGFINTFLFICDPHHFVFVTLDTFGDSGCCAERLSISQLLKSYAQIKACSLSFAIVCGVKSRDQFGPSYQIKNTVHFDLVGKPIKVNGETYVYKVLMAPVSNQY